jgi:phospholipid/cholesterol/gamma-HCH transport system substrate-binding protein
MTGHWKLGLFVVTGLGLGLTTVALLGARSLRHEVGLYVSWFDESVQGLDVGSPIKFRGVTLGTVAKIQVAPDHRHVEVESALGVEELARLGLDIAETPVPLGTPRKLVMAPDLRLQLASAGLTGVKFLQLDFFDERAYPPPVLPFAVPENYIPTAPSMFKNLENSLTSVVSRLPEVTDQVSAALREIEIMTRALNAEHIPARVVASLDAFDRAVGSAEHLLKRVDSAKLSQTTIRALQAVQETLHNLDALVARVDRPDGLLSRAEQTTRRLGDTLQGADAVGDQLIDTLRAAELAARSLRLLTQALEAEPDMLVKGRSAGAP